ncbi:unnamed protein product [Lota lota]
MQRNVMSKSHSKDPVFCIECCMCGNWEDLEKQQDEVSPVSLPYFTSASPSPEQLKLDLGDSGCLGGVYQQGTVNR